MSEEPSTESGAGPPKGGTAKGEPTVVELGRAELAAARRVAEAKAIVPHLYATAEVTLAPAEPGIEPIDLLIRAAALGLREHSRVNSSYRDGRVSEHSRVNVAFELPRRVAAVAPVIADADRKAVAEIAAQRGELTARAADGAITAPELAGATFTVSAIAADGIRDMFAVVHPPQVAILAAGAAHHADEGLGLALSLAFDGRVLDAGVGSAFLATVRALLSTRSALDG